MIGVLQHLGTEIVDGTAGDDVTVLSCLAVHRLEHVQLASLLANAR